jgi:hypothetical protein
MRLRKMYLVSLDKFREVISTASTPGRRHDGLVREKQITQFRKRGEKITRNILLKDTENKEMQDTRRIKADTGTTVGSVTYTTVRIKWRGIGFNT